MLQNYSRTWDLAPLVWPLYCLHGWHLFRWDVLLPCIQPSIFHLLWLSFWHSGYCIPIPGVCLLYKKPSFSVSALLYPSPPLGYMYPSKPIYSTPQKSVTFCFPAHSWAWYTEMWALRNKSNFLQFWDYFWRLPAFLCLYKLSVRIVLLYLPMLPNQSLLLTLVEGRGIWYSSILLHSFCFTTSHWSFLSLRHSPVSFLPL